MPIVEDWRKGVFGAPYLTSVCFDLWHSQIGIYEWCWALDFSTDDPDHCRLAGVLESTTGISHRDPPERCINTALRALAASGLRVLEWEDLGGKNDAIPWTTPLQRALASSDMEWPETDTSPVSPLFGGLSRSAAQVIIEASRRNVGCFTLTSFTFVPYGC